MFGKNKLSKQNLRVDGVLNVVEIFPTIQGEGPFAGEPAIFIRLAGCNLKCYFCDTDFESNAKEYTVTELLHTIAALKTVITTDLIVITGGEPMLQNILPLMRYLIPEYRIQIETAGTVWVPGLESFFIPGMHRNVFIVCSPKTGKVHKNIQRYCNDWKYIVTEGCESSEDGLPVTSTQQEGDLLVLARPQFVKPRIYLQPCDEQNGTRNERNLQLTIELAMQYGYHVCLQLHKLMGVE